MILAATYKRITFERLTAREEIDLCLTVVHANAKAWDQKHRDEIRLDNAVRWRFTEASLISAGATP